MSQVSILLIIAAFGIYLLPTITVYKKLKRYDDKSPGFFMMQLRIRTSLKKLSTLNKVLYRSNAYLPKLCYITTFSSIIIFTLAFII